MRSIGYVVAVLEGDVSIIAMADVEKLYSGYLDTAKTPASGGQNYGARQYTLLFCSSYGPLRALG